MMVGFGKTSNCNQVQLKQLMSSGSCHFFLVGATNEAIASLSASDCGSSSTGLCTFQGRTHN